MSQFLIYGLIDPRTRMVRYVGRSSSGLKRPNGHYWNALNSSRKSYLYDWLRSSGQRPEVCVLQTINDQCELNLAEVWWIAYGRLSDWPLTNLTAGGEGLTEASEETRKKMSENTRRQFENPAAKERVAEQTKQRWAEDHEGYRAALERGWTDEARERASAAQSARFSDPKMRKQISETRKAQYLENPELRETLSHRATQQFSGPDTRLRMSEKLKSYSADPIVRQRLSRQGTLGALRRWHPELVEAEERRQMEEDACFQVGMEMFGQVYKELEVL